jgi:hypothetical protein
MKKIIYIFIIFIKNFIKNKNYNFFLYHDEISKISTKIGPGRHAMSVGPKLTVLGVLTSGGRVNVSRFGTHRSNEWEGRCGYVVVFHAARDNTRSTKCLNNEYERKMNKTPSFRQAPNVYNGDISIAVAIGACVAYPMPKVIQILSLFIECKYKM